MLSNSCSLVMDLTRLLKVLDSFPWSGVIQTIIGNRSYVSSGWPQSSQTGYWHSWDNPWSSRAQMQPFCVSLEKVLVVGKFPAKIKINRIFCYLIHLLKPCIKTKLFHLEQWNLVWNIWRHAVIQEKNFKRYTGWMQLWFKECSVSSAPTVQLCEVQRKF